MHGAVRPLSESDSRKPRIITAECLHCKHKFTLRVDRAIINAEFTSPCTNSAAPLGVACEFDLSDKASITCRAILPFGASALYVPAKRFDVAGNWFAKPHTHRVSGPA